MIAAIQGVLIALAAMSLGLRATSILVLWFHPMARLAAAGIAGAVLAIATLQLSDRYGVHDLGLGLLISLSPVGVFDVLKWWFRWKRPRI